MKSSVVRVNICIMYVIFRYSSMLHIYTAITLC